MKITKCPSCGGGKVKKVRRDFRGTFHGETYIVPSLDFYECPDCGENVFDREAMRKIEAHSPAFVLAAH
jgi:YgiT-type zinc finger domain-containing protein